MQRERVGGAALLAVGRHHGDGADLAADVGEQGEAGARMPSSLVTRMFIRAARPARPSRIFTTSSIAARTSVASSASNALPRRRAQLAGAPVLVDPLPGAVDGELLGVQQVLHQHDQLDLAALVDPVARAVLGRVEEAELALPVAEHVGLEVRERADLADGIKLLDRPRWWSSPLLRLEFASHQLRHRVARRLPAEQDLADLLDDRQLHAHAARRAPRPRATCWRPRRRSGAPRGSCSSVCALRQRHARARGSGSGSRWW